jgi:hypothetical protein
MGMGAEGEAEVDAAEVTVPAGMGLVRSLASESRGSVPSLRQSRTALTATRRAVRGVRSGTYPALGPVRGVRSGT